MKEVETGRVRIENVDPPSFEHFLKYLYTGMLEFLAMDEELFIVADKYQVNCDLEGAVHSNQYNGDIDESKK